MTAGNWIELAVAIMAFAGLVASWLAMAFQAGKLRGTIGNLADVVKKLSDGQDGLEASKAAVIQAQAAMEQRVATVERLQPTVEDIRREVIKMQTTQELQHADVAKGQDRLERAVEGLQRQLGHLVTGGAGKVVELGKARNE